jgi:hypothetical protein
MQQGDKNGLSAVVGCILTFEKQLIVRDQKSLLLCRNQILGKSANLWNRLLALSWLSARNILATTGQICMKFDIWGFFENLSRKFKFHQNWTRIKSTLHEDQYTFLVISRSVLLRMRNVSDTGCRENQNTHFVFGNSFSKIVLYMR